MTWKKCQEADVNMFARYSSLTYEHHVQPVPEFVPQSKANLISTKRKLTVEDNYRKLKRTASNINILYAFKSEKH